MAVGEKERHKEITRACVEYLGINESSSLSLVELTTCVGREMRHSERAFRVSDIIEILTLTIATAL